MKLFKSWIYFVISQVEVMNKFCAENWLGFNGSVGLNHDDTTQAKQQLPHSTHILTEQLPHYCGRLISLHIIISILFGKSIY